MRRLVVRAYAGVAYVGFLVVIAWAVVFLADVDVVTTIDSGPRTSGLVAVTVDLLLLLAFGLHHSVMARPAAKRLITRVVPVELERATYVLTADLLLGLVLWQWRPIGGDVWSNVPQPWRAALWAVYLAGWMIAVGSTFIIDHFDLVGLRQVFSRDYRPPAFQARWLYAVVRHPLMLGLLIAFWATPTMSASHLLFALAATAYIAVGVHFEERDLRGELGQAYATYAQRTPAFVPGLRRVQRVEATVEGS